MKTITTALLVLLCACSFLSAQVAPLWGYGLGSLTNDQAFEVDGDANGNIYVLGTFSNTMDANPGAGTNYLLTAGDDDVFLTKFNAAGVYQWSVGFGDVDIDEAASLDVDAEGNAVVGWRKRVSSYFTHQVRKFSPTGTVLWNWQLPGTGYGGELEVQFAPDGSVYASDVFSGGNVDFDNGPGVTAISSQLPGSGMYNPSAYLIKLTSAGAFSWVRNISGTTYAGGTGVNIAVDSSGSPIVHYTINSSQYISKYSPTGTALYTRGISGDLSAICAAPNGDVYVTGNFVGTRTWDGIPITSGGASINNVFLVRLSSTFNLYWVKNVAYSTTHVYAQDMDLDAAGLPLITGSFNGSVDFDPSAATQTLTSGGISRQFVAKYDGNLAYVSAWMTGYGQIGASGYQNCSLYLGPDGATSICGMFTAAADFDPTAGTFTLTPVANTDAHVVKYGGCPVTTGLSASATAVCSGTSVTLTASGATSGTYTWNQGLGAGAVQTVTPSTTTTYTVTITEGACALPRSITITVSPTPNVTAGSNSPVAVGGTINLTATLVGGATYSWTGPNGFTSTTRNPAITSATLAMAGTYTVTATLNGCSSTPSSTVVVVNPTTIGGTIRHPNGTSTIRTTTVALTGPTTGSMVTGTNGQYSFNVNAGGNYTVNPSKSNDTTTNNGISTLDLVLMQRHILNIDTLNSPYKILAGDVNLSGGLTTLDIVLTRTVILQSSLTFPSGRLWTMVDASHVFPDPVNPWPFPSTRNYPSAATVANQDFFGVKLGDVNWSWNPATPKMGAVGDLDLSFGDFAAAKGEVITVPVTVENFEGIVGYQFALDWDPSVMEYVGDEAGATHAYFGISRANEGVLTVSWHDPNGGIVTLPDGARLFNLKFKMVGESNASTRIDVNAYVLNNEAYDADFNTLNIVTRKGNATVIDALTGENGVVIKTYELFPNPFSSKATLRFSLAKASPVTFTITDIQGVKVKTAQSDYPAGVQTFEWDGKSNSGQLLPAGSYLLRIDAGKESHVMRMVVIGQF